MIQVSLAYKPVCVSTWSDERCKYFQQFIASAKRNGIEPQNADPEFWPGTSWEDKHWFRKSQAQARFVRENRHVYTHFMFTDSYDILFAAGWEEIMRKFVNLNSPIVFGAECYPWPYVERAEEFPKTDRRCRYLNAGLWIATAPAALDFVEELEKRAAKRDQCDQGIVVDMFLSGKYPIKLDNECSILHCCNLDSLEFLGFQDDRIINTETGQAPCVFHGNGNADMTKILKWLNL